MASIQDVAKAANVSASTVSRVLNNSNSVKKETYDKVQAVIKELEYEPNILGRRLRTASSSMILVMLPDISNPFYSMIVKGIEDIARLNNYSIHLCNTDNDRERVYQYVNLLKSKLADGAILMSTEIKKAYIKDMLKDYHLVQCCEYLDNDQTSLVSVNDFDGAKTAVKHLMSIGRRRIALVTSQNLFISNIKREQGYKEALMQANIDANDEYIVYVDSHDYKNGVRAVEKLRMLQAPPDAIFATSDVLAIGVMRGLTQYGYRIPEDVAVVGFDDIQVASFCNPSLTTIVQPKYDIGTIALRLLLQQINGEIDEPQKVILEYDLAIRESTVGKIYP